MTTRSIGFPAAPMAISPFLRAFHRNNHLSFTIDHYLLDLDVGNTQDRQDQSKFILITHDITSQQPFDFGYFLATVSAHCLKNKRAPRNENEGGTEKAYGEPRSDPT